MHGAEVTSSQYQIGMSNLQLIRYQVITSHTSHNKLLSFKSLLSSEKQNSNTYNQHPKQGYG